MTRPRLPGCGARRNSIPAVLAAGGGGRRNGSRRPANFEPRLPAITAWTPAPGPTTAATALGEIVLTAGFGANGDVSRSESGTVDRLASSVFATFATMPIWCAGATLDAAGGAPFADCARAIGFRRTSSAR